MYIDLSHTINEATPVFPGDNKTHIEKTKTFYKNGYNGYTLSSSFHTGTHIDLPLHMLDDNRTADSFAIESFCGRGVILDVRKENLIKPKNEYDNIICENDIVLLYTNHSKYYGEPEYFENYPQLSEDFADFLVYKKIKILGLDTPSPDYSPFKIHKKLLKNDIFILENLTNLEKLLSYKNIEIYALPLKIEAEASFVRGVAKV